MDIDMRILNAIVLVILGCRFPGLLIDVSKMNPDDPNYREKRYSLGACFGGILFLLVALLD